VVVVWCKVCSKFSFEVIMKNTESVFNDKKRINSFVCHKRLMFILVILAWFAKTWHSFKSGAFDTVLIPLAERILECQLRDICPKTNLCMCL